MIFDFKLNRIIFTIGMGLMFIISTILAMVYDASVWNIIIVALLFVITTNFLMKRVANNAYRHVHQLLFIECNAEAYLTHVYELYKRGSKARKVFAGVKLQNLVMAHVFTGDYEQANAYNHEFLDLYGPLIESNASMMFSQAMIDALIPLFDYESGRFNEAFEELKEEVEKLRPQSKQYVMENPYSIYYMIHRAIHLLASESIDEAALKQELAESNEFLKTCLLYILLNNHKVSADFANNFERQPNNSLFYLDEDKPY